MKGRGNCFFCLRRQGAEAESIPLTDASPTSLHFFDGCLALRMYDECLTGVALDAKPSSRIRAKAPNQPSSTLLSVDFERTSVAGEHSTADYDFTDGHGNWRKTAAPRNKKKWRQFRERRRETLRLHGAHRRWREENEIEERKSRRCSLSAILSALKTI